MILHAPSRLLAGAKLDNGHWIGYGEGNFAGPEIKPLIQTVDGRASFPAAMVRENENAKIAYSASVAGRRSGL